jgi:hypothetical protein
MPAHAQNLALTAFRSAAAVSTSDHRPVLAAFTVVLTPDLSAAASAQRRAHGGGRRPAASSGSGSGGLRASSFRGGSQSNQTVRGAKVVFEGLRIVTAISTTGTAAATGAAGTATTAGGTAVGLTMNGVVRMNGTAHGATAAGAGATAAGAAALTQALLEAAYVSSRLCLSLLDPVAVHQSSGGQSTHSVYHDHTACC